MGKKDNANGRKRKVEEVHSDDEVDAELEAEMAAVIAMRTEKKEIDCNAAPEKKEMTMYNKEGLLKSLEEIDNQLSFSESMVVCNFTANVLNENDDIEREVTATLFIVIYSML